MSKKRIRLSQKETNQIMGYRNKHTRERFMCARFLYRTETVNGSTTTYTFRLKVRAKWLFYFILLPFVLLIEFFYVLWDGGLREFTWQGPTIVDRDINMYAYSVEYQNCMDIWDERTQ